MLHRKRLTALAWGAVLATTTMATITAGCGGGGGSTTGIGGNNGGGGGTTKSAPTAETRARVQTTYGQTIRGMSVAGISAPALSVLSMNSYVGVPIAAAGVQAGMDSASLGVPNIGGFMTNIASAPPKSRARAIAAMVTRRSVALSRAARATTRQEDVAEPEPSPKDPGDPIAVGEPAPKFYFDYYLNLWVDINETETSSTYLLFEDEAKTKPAGSIVTNFPADWTVFPQVTSSTWEVTRGPMAGGHGNYATTRQSDGSGKSSYENVYAGGGTDKGDSNWTAAGDYSWSSETTDASGYKSTDRGTFRANGSGGMRSETSDGFISDSIFNVDGSGRTTISGPLPGMPVTITWNTRGDVTIRYADGTTESFPGYTLIGAPTPAVGTGTETTVSPSKTP